MQTLVASDFEWQSDAVCDFVRLKWNVNLLGYIYAVEAKTTCVLERKPKSYRTTILQMFRNIPWLVNL